MFRDFLKLPLRPHIRNSFWKTPERMQEAIKLNSKPYIEVNYLQAMKPDLSVKVQDTQIKSKDFLQD